MHRTTGLTGAQRLFGIAILALAAMLLSPAQSAQAQIKLKTKEEKISYALGLNIGKQLKSQDIKVNHDVLARALKDVMTGGKPALSDAEAEKVWADFRKEMQDKQMEAAHQAGAKNKMEGEKFLADNAKKPGVKTTASGLQYKVVTSGSGKSPTPENSVVAHYRGTLIDGTEFDSSYSRGQPAEFPVRGVIPGWTEVLQLMKTGDKYQVYIPANLAYGDRGAPPRIGPNATLIFDIELIEVK